MTQSLLLPSVTDCADHTAWIELPNTMIRPSSGAACTVRNPDDIDHKLHNRATCQAACNNACVAVLIRPDGNCVTCSYAIGSTSFKTMPSEGCTFYTTVGNGQLRPTTMVL